MLQGRQESGVAEPGVTNAGISHTAALVARELPRADDWRLRLSNVQRRRLRIWFWSIAAATLMVIALGGTTRLTQSGLSIVEWQPLIGVVPPLNDAQWTDAFDRYRRFPEYRQLRREMTLREFKIIYFWEYLHRLLARLIGAVFLIPLLFFWRARYLPSPLLKRALALFLFGAAQGIVGWLMVKSGLIDRPSVSHYRLALHLALALIILGSATWLAHDCAAPRPRPTVPARARRIMLRGLAVVGTLLAAQILWGAFVAGLKAGFLYNTFPLMAERLFPPGGMTFEPPLLNFVQNQATVQWVHRVLGTVLLAATAIFAVRIRQLAPDTVTGRLHVALLTAVGLQYLIGILVLVLRVPVPLGVLHQAMAAIIVGLWVACVHHVRDMRVLPVAAFEEDRVTYPPAHSA